MPYGAIAGKGIWSWIQIRFHFVKKTTTWRKNVCHLSHKRQLFIVLPPITVCSDLVLNSQPPLDANLGEEGCYDSNKTLQPHLQQKIWFFFSSHLQQLVWYETSYQCIWVIMKEYCSPLSAREGNYFITKALINGVSGFVCYPNKVGEMNVPHIARNDEFYIMHLEHSIKHWARLQ